MNVSSYNNKTFEDTYPHANMLAGLCSSYNVDQVKTLLRHGVEITDRAKQITAFTRALGSKGSKRLGEASEKLDDATEQLHRALKKGKEFAADVSAACDIAEAIDILDRWILPGSAVGSQEAARAFDRLFGGVGRFFSKLPPPFNRYGDIFAEICKVSFFSTMEETMQHGQATAGGRPMKDVLDSIDRPN